MNIEELALEFFTIIASKLFIIFQSLAGRQKFSQ